MSEEKNTRILDTITPSNYEYVSKDASIVVIDEDKLTCHMSLSNHPLLQHNVLT